MRSYALIVVLAAVFISHEARVVTHRKRIPTISFIARIEGQLIRYEKSRNSVVFNAKDESAEEIAEKKVEELIEVDLKKLRGIQGKDLDNYRERLQSKVDKYMRHYMASVEMCEEERKREGLVDSLIIKLRIEARDLMHAVGYIESCKKSTEKKKCLRDGPKLTEIQDRFQEFNKEVQQLVEEPLNLKNEHPLKRKERYKMERCWMTSYDHFENSLVFLYEILDGIPVVEPEQRNSNSTDEEVTESSPEYYYDDA